MRREQILDTAQNNLSVSWDSEDGIVLLFTPNVDDTPLHYHIELPDEASSKLRDFLNGDAYVSITRRDDELYQKLVDILVQETPTNAPLGIDGDDALRLIIKERDDLRALINTPHTHDWIEAVKLEAAHQILRWGSDHDRGKEPSDWIWLLGWLAGKAVHAAIKGDIEKAKHHTISSGAVLLNWFRRLNGEDQSFQPGIAMPDSNRTVDA